MTTFKELRLARGLTQQQLAEQAHVSAWLAQALDKGHRPRSAPVREAVARVLGVGPDELFPR